MVGYWKDAFDRLEKRIAELEKKVEKNTIGRVQRFDPLWKKFEEWDVSSDVTDIIADLERKERKIVELKEVVDYERLARRGLESVLEDMLKTKLGNAKEQLIIGGELKNKASRKISQDEKGKVRIKDENVD